MQHSSRYRIIHFRENFVDRQNFFCSTCVAGRQFIRRDPELTSAGQRNWWVQLNFVLWHNLERQEYFTKWVQLNFVIWHNLDRPEYFTKFQFRTKPWNLDTRNSRVHKAGYYDKSINKRQSLWQTELLHFFTQTDKFLNFRKSRVKSNKFYLCTK